MAKNDVWIRSEDRGDQVYVEWGNENGLIGTEMVSREEYYATPESKSSSYNSYDDEPDCVAGCGGDWPNCKYTCPLYDD